MTDTTPPRRGLGRGLGSLIPTTPPAERAEGPGQGAGGGTGTSVADRPGASPDWIGRIPAGSPPPQGGSGRHAAESDAPSTPAGGDAAPAVEAVVEAVEAVETQRDEQLVGGAWFAELPVEAISPNPRQPRLVFEEEPLAELVHSIKEVGLLQPVVVRPLPSEAGQEQRYELVMGERRWRATQEAGLDTIPAIVRETGDDDMLRDALLENLHRVQLNPLEEAAAYQQLLEDFGCTHEDLAGRIGRSRPQISNTLRLLKLSPPVQRRVAAGVLSAGHARALLGVVDGGAQDRLAGRVVAEGISVRALEEIVALGEHGEEAAPAPRRKQPTSPALLDLADRLSDLFDTRVKVDLGRSKGKITIEYATLEDLDRIIGTIDPSYERRQGDDEAAAGGRGEARESGGVDDMSAGRHGD